MHRKLQDAITSKKTVSFDPVVSGVAVLSIYDYTPGEVALCWYDDGEMFRITKRCWKVLKNMESGNAHNKTYCIRGLEGHSKLGSDSKTRNRETAIAAVLLEQWKQRMDDNEVAEDAIAEAYRRTTSSCQIWAQGVGKRDREIAQAILSQEDESDSDHKLDDDPGPTDATSIITATKHAPQNAPKQPSSSSIALSRVLLSV